MTARPSFTSERPTGTVNGNTIARMNHQERLQFRPVDVVNAETIDVRTRRGRASQNKKSAIDTSHLCSYVHRDVAMRTTLFLISGLAVLTSANATFAQP